MQISEGPQNVWLGAAAALGAAVVIGAVRGAQGRWKTPSLGVVLVGGGLTWLLGVVPLLARYPEYARAIFDLSSDPLQKVYRWVAWGFFWLLIYHALRLTGLTSGVRLVIAIIGVAFGETVYSTVSYAAESRIFSLDRPLLPVTPVEQFVQLFTEPWGFVSLASTGLQVWIVSLWVKAWRREAPAKGDLLAVGLGGTVMSKLTNQATRLLCASVMLGHGGAREKLLSWLKDRNRAVALELGVDLRLAAQLARYAEKRAKRGWWTYFGILCGSLILAPANAVFLYLGALAAAIFWTARKLGERDNIGPLFSPHRFSAEEVAARFPAELEGEDLSALPHSDQNFFVYGGFTPFAGAGHDIGGWSVAIPLDKPKETLTRQKEIESFEIPEVYAAIDLGLERLSVSGIQKSDSYFVNGTDVRGNWEFLPDNNGRPVQRLEEEAAVRYRFGNDEKVRHYRCYRILDWGGELALSYYLRCCRRGDTLFVETKRFILTPLAKGCREVDGMTPADFNEKALTLLGGMIAGPILAVVSPVWVYIEIARAAGKLFGFEDRQRRKLIAKNPLFNYGAVTSLRQALSSNEYGHYFQSMDADLYSKLFEREILDTLVEFLDARGIDTSDLKERQTTILNTGVLVQGGDIKAESLAVGKGSRAIKKVASVLAPKTAAKGAGA